jgi:hypothetical protein
MTSNNYEDDDQLLEQFDTLNIMYDDDNEDDDNEDDDNEDDDNEDDNLSFDKDFNIDNIIKDNKDIIIDVDEKLEKFIIDNQLKCPQNTIDKLKIGIFNLDINLIIDYSRKNGLYDNNFQNELGCVVDALLSDDNLTKDFFANYISDIHKIINDSSYGDVYNIVSNNKLNQEFFAIKIPKSVHINIYHEAIIGMLALNKLREILPNFMFIYGLFYCSQPLKIPNTNNSYKICPINGLKYGHLVMENIFNSKSLQEIVNSLTPQEFLNIYLQIINALNLAHKEFDFTHFDLHYGNVLIQELEEPISIPLYTDTKEIIYIKSNKLARIIDYGKSHISINIPELNKKLSFSFNSSESFYKKGNPLYDVYKLLMFCAEHIQIQPHKNLELYRFLLEIYKLFKQKDDLFTKIKGNLHAFRNGKNRVDYYTYQPRSFDYNLDQFIYILYNMVEKTDEIEQTFKSDNIDISILDKYKQPNNLQDIYYIYSILDKEIAQSYIEQVDYMKLYENEYILNINLFNSLLELFKDTNIFMFENFNSDTFNIGTLNVYSIKLDSIIYIISNIQDLLSWINMVRMIKFLISSYKIYQDIDNMIVFENKCNLLKINTIQKYNYILQYNQNKFLDMSVFKYDINIYRKINHIKNLHQDILKNA